MALFHLSVKRQKRDADLAGSAGLDGKISQQLAGLQFAGLVLDDVKDCTVALLQNPAVTMVGSVVLMNELYRHGKLSDTQVLALEAAILTPEFVKALTSIAPLLAKAI